MLHVLLFIQLIPQIVDVGWDSKKMRESSHDWVDTMVHSCTDVWEYMLLTDQFAELSSLVREQVILYIYNNYHMSSLSFYSRVQHNNILINVSTLLCLVA